MLACCFLLCACAGPSDRASAPTATPTPITRSWTPPDQEYEVGFGAFNAIKMKVSLVVRTNRTDLLADDADVDENTEFMITSIEYRSTQGGTHVVNPTADFHVTGSRSVSPLPSSSLRDPSAVLEGSVPINQSVKGQLIFRVNAGEEFRRLVYTAGRAPKEIDIAAGALAIKPAVPTSAAAVATRSAVSAERTAIAAQTASEALEAERAAGERISDYLGDADAYRQDENYGLALITMDQAIAAEPGYQPAQELRGQIAAQATAQVERQERAAAAAAAAAAQARQQELTAYANYMIPKLQTVQYAAENLELDGQLLRLRPSLIYDANWRLRVAAALFLYQNTGKELQTYAPVPADLRALDNTMVAFGKDLEYIADQMVRGLDNPNGPYLTNATRRADGLQDRARRITTQLNALR
jgi:hypothetical protein